MSGWLLYALYCIKVPSSISIPIRHYWYVHLCAATTSSPSSFSLSHPSSSPRIRSLATEGFVLAGRTYALMGFSSTQIKEGPCWFIDKALLHGPDVITAAYGRFGNFRNIKR